MCVCRSGGKINTRHWNWFVLSVVNVYMSYCECVIVCICVSSQFCCFALLPLQPDLIYHGCHCPQLSSQAPSTSSSPANVHVRLKQVDTQEHQVCINTHTQTLRGRVNVKDADCVIEFKIKVNLCTACNCV